MAAWRVGVPTGGETGIHAREAVVAIGSAPLRGVELFPLKRSTGFERVAARE